MATEEKVAPGSDWHIPVRTTAGEVWCTLCKKANGSRWKGGLPKETIGHIQRAAHNACIRELLQAMDMHGKTDRQMRLLTIEKESRRVHSGIKNSVHRFALRRNCGKQRKRKK